MRVRKAQEKDINEISRLLIMLFDQEAEFKPDYEAQKRGVGLILSNPELGIFFVLEDQGNIIGVINLLFSISTALGGKVATLEDFIVDKSYRNKGYGTLLLKKAIQHTKESGCLRITLFTDLDNYRAQELYKKYGFNVLKMNPMRLVF